MPLSSQVEEYQRVVTPAVALLAEEGRITKAKQAFIERYTKLLRAGETLPDLGFLLELLSRELQGEQSNIEGADQAYVLEESDDPAVRQVAEEATTAVYDEVVQLRGEASAIYGEAAIAALGMTGETTRVPLRLARHARTIAERLSDEKISLGKSKSARLTLDRRAASSALFLLCDALDAALSSITREKAELQQVQDERNRALNQWEERVPGACATIRGLLLISGDAEGAGRVLSTPKRRVSHAEPAAAATAAPSEPKTGA